MRVPCANSRVEYLALEISLYSFFSILLLIDLAKAERSFGTVFENSARSITESVVFYPLHFLPHSDTKSSTIFFPMSSVGIEVLLPSFESQFV